MKLTRNDVERISFGALRIEEHDRKFNFFRFSREQEAVYEREHPEYRRRTEGTASVMLDFVTDTENLSFSFSTESKAGPLINYAFIDVWVEGIMTAHVGAYTTETREDKLSLALKKGEKHITVYLPSMFKTTLWDIALDDGAMLRPAEKKYKVLMLGDSITHGYEAHFPSLNYANTVIRDLGLDAVNQAIGGEVFRPSILGTSPLFKPDFITLALGTNDWNGHTAAEEYFGRLTDLYKRSKIYYISPIWRSNLDERFLEAVEKFEEIAKKHGAEVIHGLNLLHHTPEMYTDGLHPNDLGFTQYAKALVAALKDFGIN